MLLGVTHFIMSDETETGIRPTTPPQPIRPPEFIGDFGEKIAGARKDLRGNVTRDDIVKMTPEERLELVVKNTVWPTPDWESLVKEGGCNQKGALLIKLIRDSFPAGPMYAPNATEDEKMRTALAYNTLLNAAKGICSKARTENELADLLRSEPEAAEHLVRLSARSEPGFGYRVAPSIAADKFGAHVNEAFRGDRYVARDIIFALKCAGDCSLDSKSAKLLRRNPAWPENNSQAEIWLRTNRLSTLQEGPGWVIAYAGRSSTIPAYRRYLEQFGFKDEIGKVYGNEEEASSVLLAKAEAKYAEKRDAAKAKREAVIARALGKPVGGTGPMVDRVGRDWREGRQASGEDYLTTFGLRGGQWGNYVPQKMRPELLNKGFDSLCDLADALDVPQAAISFGGHLAIAFGARGNGGNAAAHYEPKQKVMNFTKLNGAGCVAHEVGHAFDHFLGSKAAELGLVSQTRDPQMAGFLTNVDLKPAGDPARMSAQEKLIRDLHSRFDSIWLNSDPLTKPEFMERAENDRSKAIASLMGMVSYAESFVNQPHSRMSEEDKAKFAELAKRIRNPEKGQELASYTDGVVGMVHLPAIQGSSYSQPLTVMLQGVRNSMQAYDEKRALPEDHLEQNRRPFRTEYAKACGRVDADRSKPYYAKREEMLARTFEALVVDAMKEKDNHNYFLCDGSDGEAFPQGKEREKFGKTIMPLIARLPELMPELTVVPPRAAAPVTPVRQERELVASDQMALF